MSWQDDLSARLQAATQNIGNDIKGYLQARVVDPVVKIGEPAKGNLSALELSQGARGSNSNAQIVPDTGAMPTSSSAMNAIPFLIVGVIAFLLISKKRG